MYSAVLMLALTVGSETADFGRNRCGGGGGNYGCSGAYVGGGCSAGYGCSSSRHHGGGLFGGRSGCNSGYGGGYGCSSNYACGGRTGMFSGGLFGGHHHNRGGCTGGGYGYACSGYGASYGCSGSGASYGCSGGVVGGCATGTPVVVPPAKALPKPSEPVPQPKKTTQSTAPATIIVSLPADARLFVDGNSTVSTTAVRTLVTPELAIGSTYVYTMRAEIVRDGQVQSQTQQVNVIGGQTATVQFSLSSQGVASR
jgi:uncharacterized protein (TIGR03000 family)